MGWFVSSKKTNISEQEFPEVRVKERLKKVEIKGFSRMILPHAYYEELMRNLENYFFSFRNTLIIDFTFEYINTSSTKWLHIILQSLEKVARNKGMIEINWYYESDDETIQETGELLKSIVNIPFHLREI